MLRTVLIGVPLALAALAAIYALGPRVASDTTIRFDPNPIGNDVEGYLAFREADVPNIRPGNAKEVVWADPDTRGKTPLSIVYIHGFSASKGEIRPVPDRVAKALGANLFFTRLTGHGQDGPAMATASVNAWVNDMAEALAIGRAIGERVIVMATSTGGSLATWAATRPELSENVVAYVLLSPNFGVQAAGAGLLTGPWGLQLAELVGGKERGFEPANDLQRQFWTTRYPMAATLPMAAAVELARAAPVETIGVPALFLLSDEDKVIRPEAAKAVARRWGGKAEIAGVEGADHASSHVIAGDALSPNMTGPVSDKIVQWIRTVIPAR